MTATQSEFYLASAFNALVDYMVALPLTGKSEEDAPTFSYLLSVKQFDRVAKICVDHGWPPINCRGVLIDANAVMHPLQTRLQKDSCTVDEVKEILVRAYSPQSLIATNRHYDQQTLMFNTREKVRVGSTKYHGLAVLELRSTGGRNYLAPVTAYHATEAKIRALDI